MKASALNTTDVLAHQTSIRYGAPKPARLIDLHMWTTKKALDASGAATYVLTPSRGTAPLKASDWMSSGDVGYPALVPASMSRSAQYEEIAKKIASAELPEKLNAASMATLKASLPDGIDIGIVSNRELRGTWAAVHGAYCAGQEAEQAARDAENRAVEEARKGFQRLKQELNNASLWEEDAVRPSGDYRQVTLDTDTLQEIAAKLNHLQGEVDRLKTQ
jgi:hypothetical protein